MNKMIKKIITSILTIAMVFAMAPKASMAINADTYTISDIITDVTAFEGKCISLQYVGQYAGDKNSSTKADVLQDLNALNKTDLALQAVNKETILNHTAYSINDNLIVIFGADHIYDDGECMFCRKEEPALPTAAEVSAAFEGKTFAGFVDDMAVLISTKDGFLTTSFGTSGFASEINDYTIEEGKDGASYTLSHSNDAFWNIYLDEQGEIESVNFVQTDYLETGIDISCALVADNNLLDSSDFLDKFASGYTASATKYNSDLGKDVTVYMVLDYEEGNIMMPGEDGKLPLAIGDKVIKVSDDEYILVTSLEVAPGFVFTVVLGMTLEDGVVESLSIAGGNYSRDAIIEDTKTVDEYTLDSETLSSLHCNLPHDKFAELFVDEELVDEENYSIEEGSTVVKFIKEYLNSLSVGKHKVELKYDMDGDAAVDKVVETSITINSNTPAPTPKPESKPESNPTPTTPYKAPNTGVR